MPPEPSLPDVIGAPAQGLRTDAIDADRTRLFFLQRAKLVARLEAALRMVAIAFLVLSFAALWRLVGWSMPLTAAKVAATTIAKAIAAPIARAVGHRLLVAVGVGLAGLVTGAALGYRPALLLAVLVGVPFELPVSWELRSEAGLLGRKARWLVRFLGQRPRGHNTPGGHLACGAMAVKKLLKRAALRRERRTPEVRQLVRRRAFLLRQRDRSTARAFANLVHRTPAPAARAGQVASVLADELAKIDAELFRRRLEIQTVVVEAFGRAFEHAWLESRGATATETADYRRVLEQFRQPGDEPPALLPSGLVRRPLALAFDYGMFFGRITLALLFVSTAHTSYLVVALLLFAIDLYVVEPVVFKLHVGALNLLLDVPGHKLADCQQQIAALTGGSEVFRFPIIVPKFSSNPASTQLAAIIEAAARRAGTRPVRVIPFAMHADNRRTRIELPDGPAAEVEKRGAQLVAALRSELEAQRARFPLAVSVEQEGRQVSLSLNDDAQRIWEMIGEDASQAFVYLWKNLHALRDTLDHLGPRFQPVFIFASNSRDPDVIQYEIDHLTHLQWWADRHHHGQVGFLYLLRAGAWYNYNPRLRRFDPRDKDFVTAFPGLEQELANPDNPLARALAAALPGPSSVAATPATGASALSSSGAPGGPGGHTDGQRQANLARVLNGLLGDPELWRHFDRVSFDGLPDHRQPRAATRALFERRRAGQSLSGRELLELNRELIFTALPMRGAGAFFKKVGNDIAVEELLVAGKSRPTVYTDRRTHEHVQDASRPNYGRVWGDFARYTGLRGSNEEIQAAILAGRDLTVDSVPAVAAIIDDKNSFAPGEIEKGLATMLHPENRHIVIGVPRIEVSLPEDRGVTISTPFARGVKAAREVHNSADALTRAGIFDLSSAAYGKWFMRPEAYFAHYELETLNAAHALSHDFQQSYLVAGAGGRLASFTEALYGPSRFEVTAEVPRPSAEEAEALRQREAASRDRDRERERERALRPAAASTALQLRDVRAEGGE